MTARAHPLAPLWVFAVFGAVLSVTHGMYNPRFLGILLGCALLSAVPVDFGKAREVSPAWRRRWLALVLLFFCSLGVWNPGMIYAVRESDAYAWFSSCARLLLTASLILFMSTFPVTSPGLDRWMSRLLGLCFLVAFAMKILVLVASPNPFIDVFVVSTIAAKSWLTGVNPYTLEYPDIYRGVPGFNFPNPSSFGYFPGVLYWITPFTYLLHDVRSSFIAADALSVFLLVKLGRRFGMDRFSRLALALLWLTFPAGYFVLEQSWNDGLLACMASALVYCLATGRLTMAGALSGAMIGTKQYAFLTPLMLFPFVGGRWGARALVRMAGVSALTALLVFLPFLVWDPSGFLKRAVSGIASVQTRTDSLSIPAFLHNQWGVRFNGLPRAVVTLALITIVWGLLLRKGGAGTSRWPGLSTSVTGIFFSYLAIFCLGFQAFCNYYYFVAFFALLLVAVSDLPSVSLARGNSIV